MPSISEQFSSAAQTQLAAQLTVINALSHTAFGSMQKLLALQMNSVKESLENSAATTRELLEVKAPQEFLAFSAAKTQPNLQKIFSFARDLATISGTARNEFMQAVGVPATGFSTTFAHFTQTAEDTFSPNTASTQNTEKKVSPSKKASAAKAETVEIKEATASNTSTTKPVAKPKAETVAKTEVVAKAATASKPAAKVIAKTEPEVAPKVATKVASKVATNIAEKSAPKAAASKAASKVEVKPASDVKADAPAVKAVKTATKATTTVKTETSAVETPKIVITKTETLAVSKPAEVKANPVKAEATKVEATKVEANKETSIISTEEKPAQATPVTDATTANEENKLSVTGLPAKPLAKSGFPGNDRPAFKAKSSSATGAKMRVRQ